MTEDKYVSMSEVKGMLEKESENRELTYEQSLALQHVQTFVKLSPTRTRKLIKELEALEIVSSENAVKLADVLPTEPEDVRSVFAKERFSLEKEDVDKILEIVSEYL